MCPSYANIIMGNFEKTFILSKLKKKSLLYLRYIDDIFLIWTDTNDSLEKFLKEINTIHPSIKFEAQKSKEEIHFLDTTVYIKNNRLLTKLYRKPTDRQSYLNNKSYHPNSTKRGIPYSQALRMKRICSEQDELKKNLDHLKLTLLSRGYAKDHIHTQFQKVMSTKREDTLKYKSKEQSKHRIRLILTYNKQMPNFKNVIDRNWPLLQIDDKTSQAFKENPIIGI